MCHKIQQESVTDSLGILIRINLIKEEIKYLNQNYLQILKMNDMLEETLFLID